MRGVIFKSWFSIEAKTIINNNALTEDLKHGGWYSKHFSMHLCIHPQNNFFEMGMVIISTSQTRRDKYREVKWLIQHHPASEKKNWKSNFNGQTPLAKVQTTPPHLICAKWPLMLELKEKTLHNYSSLYLLPHILSFPKPIYVQWRDTGELEEK